MLRFYKDPDAELDFLFDWSSWLAVGETIASHTLAIVGNTGTNDLVLDSSSENSGIVTAWLSGGDPGTVYKLICDITTDIVPARGDQRTMHIRIQER